VPVPDELREKLEELLGGEPAAGPLFDVGAVYRLRTGGGGHYGSRLLHGVMWPARRGLDPSPASAVRSGDGPSL
jgi:hypothetical protein